MKNLRFLFFAAAILGGGWASVYAQQAAVKRNNFWTVELLESRRLEISPGDMILLKPPTYALVPANLEKWFDVAYDHSKLRLVAEEPPEGEGRMGKRYYFVAQAPGEVEIRVQIKDDERVVQTLTLGITCK